MAETHKPGSRTNFWLAICVPIIPSLLALASFGYTVYRTNISDAQNQATVNYQATHPQPQVQVNTPADDCKDRIDKLQKAINELSKRFEAAPRRTRHPEPISQQDKPLVTDWQSYPPTMSMISSEVGDYVSTGPVWESGYVRPEQ